MSLLRRMCALALVSGMFLFVTGCGKSDETQPAHEKWEKGDIKPQKEKLTPKQGIPKPPSKGGEGGN